MTDRVEIIEEDLESLFEQAMSCYAQTDYKQAVALYSKVIEISPAFMYLYDQNIYLNRGFSYYQTKNYELALDDFSKIILLPDNTQDIADAYYNKGLCYLEEKNHELAIINFSNTIDLEPYHIEPYQNRGLCYLLKSNYKLALQDCTTVIKKQPNSQEAYCNRGICYLKQGSYELALSDLSKAIELDIDYASAYYVRATCYEELKKYHLSLIDYKRLLTYNLNITSDLTEQYVHQNICTILHVTSDNVDDFLDELSANSPHNYSNKGSSEKSNPKKGQSNFLDMYGINARQHYEQGNYELAAIDWSKSTSQNRNIFQGDCYFHLKKYDIALSSYLEYIEFPSFFKKGAFYTYFKIAMCYFETKQYDFSLSYINEAIKFSKSLEDNKKFCFFAKIIACRAKKYGVARSYIEQAFDKEGKAEQVHKSIYLEDIDKAEDLDLKNQQLEQAIKEKELAYQAVHDKEKEMLSFFTHTMRNALATAPESLRQAVRLLNTEDYESDKKHYKAINKIVSLFSTLSLTDCLIDTFKQSISEPEEFQRAWKNDITGDATPKWVIASALRQSLNRIIFMSDTSELRQLLHGADTATIIATRKSFIDEVLPLNVDNQGIEAFYQWLVAIDTLDIQIEESRDLHFGANQVKFSLLFSITSELLLNALKYWDGTGKITVRWYHEQDNFILKVSNPCQEYASSNLAGTHKGLAFIKRLIELLGEQASFTPIAEKSCFTVEFKLHQSLLEG